MRGDVADVCAECGGPVETDRAGGLCPACAWSWLTGSEAHETGSPELDSGSAGGLAIPGYTVIEEIARGGMGIVYRAREHEPNREVALKMLLPFQAHSAEMRERFRHEFHTAALFDHPGILPIYRTGEQDGLPFFTMKLAAGGTLAERLDRYRGQPRRTAELMATIAEAVHAAHGRGILHRDLKPGNILFDEEDKPYVADFGLAKLIETDRDDARNLTRSASLLGTPHYVPPEVAEHGVRDASVSGDVYGLGAVLYHVLTGQPPFTGTQLTRLLTTIVEHEPERPRKVDPTVPRDLETICLTCLSKEPARRYDSAGELARDLRRWLANEPISARPASPFERLVLWTRRHPAAAIVTGVIAVLIAVAAVQTVNAVHRGHEAESANVKATRELRNSLLIQARMTTLGQSPARRDIAVDALTRAAGIEPAADMLENAVTALSMFQVRDLGVQIPNPDGQLWISMSPDLSRYVWYGKERDSLLIRSLPDHRIVGRLELEGRQTVDRVGWLPDGTRVVIRLRSGVVQLSNVDSGITDWTFSVAPIDDGAELFYPGYFAVDPSGRWVTVFEKGSLLILLHADSGEEAGRFPFPEPPAVMTFNPKQPWLAVALENSVRVYDFLAGREVMKREPLDQVKFLSWSPDGGRLSLSGYGLSFGLWDLTNDAYQGTTGVFGGPTASSCFSPDGRWLAEADMDGNLTVRHADSVRPIFDGLTGFPVTFDADSRRLYCQYGLNGVNVYELAPGRCHQELEIPFFADSSLPGVAISPDEQWIAASSYSTGVFVWNLARGGPPVWKSFEGVHSSGVHSVVFEHTGTKLLTGSRQGLHVWEWKGGVAGGDLSEPALLQACFNDSGRHPTMTFSEPEQVVISSQEGVWAVSLRDLSERRLLQGSNRFSAAMSPDGRWLAEASFYSPITLRDLMTEEMTELSPRGGLISFSPDGRWLTAGRGGSVEAWGTSTWKPAWRRETRTMNPSTGHCVFRPQGDLLATLDSPKEIALLRPSDGALLLRLVAPRPAPISRMTFSRSGRVLAASTEDGCVQVWRLDRLETELREIGLDWTALAGMPRFSSER